jgi:Skp family chaperone for outer membrane proteins
VTRVLLTIAAGAVAAWVLGGCSGAKSGGTDEIGTVNVSRITANWPKFLNYQNQLTADASAIDRENAPDATKSRERADLQQRFLRFQDEVTNDVRTAAEQVAGDRHLKLVVTREFVGYGGVDITPDVEKILKITEAASPSPHP